MKKKIDIMAHCWGFLAGLVEGGLAEALVIKKRFPERGQKWAGLAAVLLVGGAWMLAMR